jgi:hypothetical protein
MLTPETNSQDIVVVLHWLQNMRARSAGTSGVHGR